MRRRSSPSRRAIASPTRHNNERIVAAVRDHGHDGHARTNREAHEAGAPVEVDPVTLRSRGDSPPRRRRDTRRRSCRRRASRPRSRGWPARSRSAEPAIRARGSKRESRTPANTGAPPSPRSRNQCRSSAQKSGMNMPPEWLATMSAGPFVGRCSKPKTSASKYVIGRVKERLHSIDEPRVPNVRKSRATHVQHARRGGRQRKDDGARPRSDARLRSTGPLCSEPSRALSARPSDAPAGAKVTYDRVGLLPRLPTTTGPHTRVVGVPPHRRRTARNAAAIVSLNGNMSLPVGERSDGGDPLGVGASTASARWEGASSPNLEPGRSPTSPVAGALLVDPDVGCSHPLRLRERGFVARLQHRLDGDRAFGEGTELVAGEPYRISASVAVRPPLDPQVVGEDPSQLVEEHGPGRLGPHVQRVGVEGDALPRRLGAPRSGSDSA